MKFDLFEALAEMEKQLGRKGEILVIDEPDRYIIRLSIILNDEFYHQQFAVSHIQGNAVMQLEFKQNLEALRRYINE